MSAWRMEAKCRDCPFAERGPGRLLRRTLGRERWQGITDAMLNGEHFICHKTGRETGDGSQKVCAGAIEYQNRHGIVAQLVQVMERLDELRRRTR